MYKSMKHFFKKISMSMLAIALLLNTTIARAAAEPSASVATSSDFKLDVNTVLTACALLLLIVILALGYTLRSSVMFYHEKRKKESSSNSGAKVVSLILAAILLASMPAMAADAAVAADATAAPTTIPDSEVLRWILFVVLGLEVVIIFLFTKLIRFFTGVDSYNATSGSSVKMDLSKVWAKMNRFKPIEEEGSLDTGHEYDGIRELNNVTPPWFIAGFVITIIFGMIYLWRYHVAQAAPLQIEEYNISVAEAKIKQAEFLKSQSNNVDENTVVVLGADGIAAGQALFTSNCVACHGDKGQGASVGPNLSDNYWLHKGGIKDIFKSIKYGWQGTAMVKWEDKFSPNQIAQLASFVHSLKGSNPAGAKEPQGDLYTETASTSTVVDSAKTPAVDTTKK
jgi:cytochrome c oxidase cbb3-type subunit 3